MTNKQKADDTLFKGMPNDLKELWAESKRLKRAKARAAFKRRQINGK